MGESRRERPDASQSPTGRGVKRVTVNEAADILGISVEAVRGRIKRGTLRHERSENAVYVLLEGDQAPSGRDQSTASNQPDDDQMTLVNSLQDQVSYLRGQLQAERDAHGETRRIVAGLVQRIPELEAPPQSAQGAESVAESASEGADRGEAWETRTEPQSAGEQERVPWWRRIFGG